MSVEAMVRVKVSGEFACWTRPENKVERVSYECMTPSAARNILDAICWRPEMRWVVTRIGVLKPVRFQALRRNEVQSKVSMGMRPSAAPSMLSPSGSPCSARLISSTARPGGGSSRASESTSCHIFGAGAISPLNTSIIRKPSNQAATFPSTVSSDS